MVEVVKVGVEMVDVVVKFPFSRSKYNSSIGVVDVAEALFRKSKM